MTHYSANPANMRVDYFKPSGKWYMTEQVEMRDWDDPSLIHAVELALDASRPERDSGWWRQFTVVVTEPYHQYACPVMIVGRA